jgi:hypothetical protein
MVHAPERGFAPLLNALLNLRPSDLTPSGDDSVLDLLLMLNRWQTNRDWSELNRGVIDAAYHKPITPGVSLIECAAQDTADKHLLHVVDGIAASSTPIEESVEYVLSWDSSSGIDALAGMVIAL